MYTDDQDQWLVNGEPVQVGPPTPPVDPRAPGKKAPTPETWMINGEPVTVQNPTPYNFNNLGSNRPITITKPNLPNVTNKDIVSWAPMIGATVGGAAATALAPEATLPWAVANWLINTGVAATGAGLGGMAGKGVEEAYDKFPPGAGKRIVNEGGKQAAFEAGGRAVGGVIGAGLRYRFDPNKLYEGWLKPPTNMELREAEAGATAPSREELVNIATGGKVPFTDPVTGATHYTTPLPGGVKGNEAGYDKMLAAIRSTDSQVKAVLNHPGPPRGLIDPANIAQRLDGLEQFYEAAKRPDMMAEVQKARKAWMEANSTVTQGWVRGPAGGPPVPGKIYTPNPLTPLEAQAVKENKYTLIRQMGGFEGFGPINENTEKALARGAKEGILALYPELAELNAKNSAILMLEPFIKKAIGRDRNKNFFGLIPAAVSAGAGWLTGHPEAGLGGSAISIGLMAMNNPTIATTVSILLKQAARNRLISTGAKTVGGMIIPGAARWLDKTANEGAPQQPQQKPLTPPGTRQ